MYVGTVSLVGVINIDLHCLLGNYGLSYVCHIVCSNFSSRNPKRRSVLSSG